MALGVKIDPERLYDDYDLRQMGFKPAELERALARGLKHTPRLDRKRGFRCWGRDLIAWLGGEVRGGD